MKINGIELDDITDAMMLLQEAGLDTSSTTMHLTALVGRESDSVMEDSVMEVKQTPIGPKTIIKDRHTGKVIASQG